MPAAKKQRSWETVDADEDDAPSETFLKLQRELADRDRLAQEKSGNRGGRRQQLPRRTRRRTQQPKLWRAAAAMPTAKVRPWPTPRRPPTAKGRKRRWRSKTSTAGRGCTSSKHTSTSLATSSKSHSWARRSRGAHLCQTRGLGLTREGLLADSILALSLYLLKPPPPPLRARRLTP